jgi:hypothetical protein
VFVVPSVAAVYRVLLVQFKALAKEFQNKHQKSKTQPCVRCRLGLEKNPYRLRPRQPLKSHPKLPLKKRRLLMLEQNEDSEMLQMTPEEVSLALKVLSEQPQELPKELKHLGLVHWAALKIYLDELNEEKSQSVLH